MKYKFENYFPEEEEEEMNDRIKGGKDYEFRQFILELRPGMAWIYVVFKRLGPL